MFRKARVKVFLSQQICGATYLVRMQVIVDASGRFTLRSEPRKHAYVGLHGLCVQVLRLISVRGARGRACADASAPRRRDDGDARG